MGASGYGAGGLYLKTALRPVSSVISSRAEAPTPSACQRWELELQRAGDTSSAITGLAETAEKTGSNWRGRADVVLLLASSQNLVAPISEGSKRQAPSVFFFISVAFREGSFAWVYVLLLKLS